MVEAAKPFEASAAHGIHLHSLKFDNAPSP